MNDGDDLDPIDFTIFFSGGAVDSLVIGNNLFSDGIGEVL